VIRSFDQKRLIKEEPAMRKLVDLFCHVDDFCKAFLPQWQKLQLESGDRKRNRKGRMSESEIMTIIVAFHMSHQRDFKNFYLGIICRYYKSDFPTLLSYTRFLEVMPSVLIPLSSFFTHVKGEPTGIEFIDSTSIKVCHNLRIPRHKVFKGTAAGVKEQWVGFMDLSCTLLPIILAILWQLNLRPLIRMTESPYGSCQKGY